MTPDQLASRLSAAASSFKPATELMRRVTRIVRDKTKAQIRRKAYDTGRMHDSTVDRVVGERGVVEVQTDYAVFVDTGTRYMRGKHFMAGGLEDAMPEVEQELEAWGNSVLGKVAGR